MYLKGTVPYFRTYPGPYIPRAIEFSRDAGEAMRRRLVIYFNQTTQVLDYYKEQHKLRVVDGNQSIDQVQKMLTSEINDYLRRDLKA